MGAQVGIKDWRDALKEGTLNLHLASEWLDEFTFITSIVLINIEWFQIICITKTDLAIGIQLLLTAKTRSSATCPPHQWRRVCQRRAIYLSQSFTMGKKFYCLFYRQLNLETSGSWNSPKRTWKPESTWRRGGCWESTFPRFGCATVPTTFQGSVQGWSVPVWLRQSDETHLPHH